MVDDEVEAVQTERVEAVPLTSTGKAVSRERDLTVATWDRDPVGLPTVGP